MQMNLPKHKQENQGCSLIHIKKKKLAVIVSKNSSRNGKTITMIFREGGCNKKY